MRIDYPAFLGPVFRDLEWYGAHLRRIHGNGTKRNIKFDEEYLSLYMDVLVPNQKEWMRVSPQMAKKERELNKEEIERTTRRRLRAPLAPPTVGSVATGSNTIPGPTRLPAGQPLIGGHTGKTQNFMDDLSRRYSGATAGDRNNSFTQHRGSNRGKDRETPMYTSPKKNQ